MLNIINLTFMDKFFQYVCNLYPAYKIDTKFKKKIFYIFFSFMNFFLKGPFVMNFKNFKIYAYSKKNDYTRFMLTRVSLPDPGERKIIIQNLKNNNNIFIDCGANAGFYSLDVATKVENVSVYAFEPSKKEKIFLKNNIDLNNIKNIKIIDKAVGDKNEKAIFNNFNNSDGGGFLTQENLESKNTYQVDVVALDSFFNKELFNNDTSIFIKIDLEGYDIKAINGAKEILLNQDCTVIFEFSKLTMKQKDYSIEDIQFFIDRGFKLYDIYGAELNCKDLETKIFELDEDHETCGNFILTKKKLNFSLYKNYLLE